MKSIRKSAGMVVLFAVATGFGASAWAEQQPATLAWNRVALQTIERAKPSQHQAVRLLAHLSLAQYAAIVQAPAGEASGAVGTASQQVIAAFFPAHSEYDMTTGTMAGGYWNEEAATSIRNTGLDERRAAVVFATLNAAMMDALVACHDAKYTYWVPRPSQVDLSIRPLIGVPNHPSFPSNHACLSTAAGRVLAHFFPSESARFGHAASEAGRSRIVAGIHYRFDVEAGEGIGERVADAAIARYTEMLARLTGTTVGELLR